MINILIVDDSKTETALLKYLFESQTDMKVIGCASDGKQAVELAERLKPDLITMDLEMPVMDGHTATRLIMSQFPTPIVVISSKLRDSTKDMTYLALEAGAVSVISKPENIGKSSKATKEMIDTIRSMAEIKVIKRRFHLLRTREVPPEVVTVKHSPGGFEILAIGTSIGGPQALKSILSVLPEDFPLPIVVVQHMTKGYITGFTTWLNNHTQLKVKNAEQNESLKKGTIYFAPDYFHFTVAKNSDGLVAKLIKSDPVSGFCPSITVLFQSVANACGKKAFAALLTGMGNDGAQGLFEIKKAGGHTIIQDEKSCVVFGMAGVAKSIGAADMTVELNKMSEYFIKMSQKLKSKPK